MYNVFEGAISVGKCDDLAFAVAVGEHLYSLRERQFSEVSYITTWKQARPGEFYLFVGVPAGQPVYQTDISIELDLGDHGPVLD